VSRFKPIAYVKNEHGAYATLWGNGEEMILEKGRWSKHHNQEQITARYVGEEVWEHWTEITQAEHSEMWGDSLYKSMED